MSATDRTHWVYTCFATDGSPLYVGRTQDLQQRRGAHRSFSHWFTQVDRVKVSGPYPFEVAQRREREAIRLLNPAHNTHHANQPVRKHRRGTTVNGFKIRVLRERAGMTQAELAEHAGCGGPQLSRIERGLNRPRPQLLQAIADALFVPVDDIRSDNESTAA